MGQERGDGGDGGRGWDWESGTGGTGWDWESRTRGIGGDGGDRAWDGRDRTGCGDRMGPGRDGDGTRELQGPCMSRGPAEGGLCRGTGRGQERTGMGQEGRDGTEGTG